MKIQIIENQQEGFFRCKIMDIQIPSEVKGIGYTPMEAQSNAMENIKKIIEKAVASKPIEILTD